MRTQQKAFAHQGTELVGGWRSGVKFALALTLALATQATLAQGTTTGTVRPATTPASPFTLSHITPSLGFEIGNGGGLRNIFNPNGGYGLSISSLWQVGMRNSFTEILTSLAEGLPRIRILLGTMAAEYINDHRDLVDSFERSGWKETTLKDVKAIRKVEDLENDMQQINWRLLKGPSEIVYISADGKKDSMKEGSDTMKKVEEAVGSINFKKDDNR